MAIRVVNTLTSFGVTTLLFAMIFKVLPDGESPGRTSGSAAIDHIPIPGGQGCHRPLPRLQQLRVGLWRGRIDGLAAGLDLLHVPDPVLRRREFTQVYANRYGSRIRPTHGPKKP
ncbi:MAG: hypothetical protein U0800_06540 [Isosphaeraceae bacterium]